MDDEDAAFADRRELENKLAAAASKIDMLERVLRDREVAIEDLRGHIATRQSTINHQVETIRLLEIKLQNSQMRIAAWGRRNAQLSSDETNTRR